MGTQSRVKGHTLIQEGAAHDDRGNLSSYYRRNGRGKCSCGELSPILSSDGQRKKWHREHKEQVIEKGGE